MTTRSRAFAATVLTVMSAGACSRKAEQAPAESPTLNVTHWTDRTELYMEYPPLVSGRPALFAVHLTRLNDFKPVTVGQARIEFTPTRGGQAAALVGPQPSRPGAFRVEGAPPA